MKRVELYNDHFQNFKVYGIPHAQLIIADTPYKYYIDLGRRYGFMHYIPLIFRKNFSAQVLKANMKIVGNCEY